MDVIAKTTNTVPMPTDLYDPRWIEFNRQNPHMPRSLGAAAGEGDGAGEGDKPAADDEAAKAEAAKKTEEDAAAAAAKAKADADKAKTTDELLTAVKKLEDEKATLLKDTMKHKAGKKNAEEALAALQKTLAETLGDGVALEDVKRVLAERKTAEEEALKKAGDFEALKSRTVSEHRKEVDALLGKHGATVKELTSKLEGAESEIRRLLVTNSFASSRFLADELLLTPAKAEKLYGDSFKVEEKDGRRVVVAYLNGEPLAGSDGKPLPFEDAFKEIIGRDPERDSIIKPKAKGGAGSGNENKGAVGLKTAPLKGVAAIAAGLNANSKK